MRNSIVALVLTAGLMAPLSAQEDSPHKAMIEQSLELLRGINKTLAAVENRETADAAVPELRKAAKKWHELRKKAEDIPPPDRAEKNRLAEKYKESLVKEERTLRGHIIRLESVTGSQPVLQEITGILKKPEQ